MTLNGKRALVIGAGIGGLASALALRRQGAEVLVLEQAEAVTEVGAGLQISPNGVAVLKALGLDETLAQRSVRAKAVVLRNFRDGGEVLRLDLMRGPPGQRFFLVHRADLINLLSEAAREAGVQIRLLQQVKEVRPGAGPSVGLGNGTVREADLIVGADGLHSRARIALNGPDNPFFTGQVAWRALVRNDAGLPPEAQVFMGPGRHLVCYPLRDRALVNIVAVQERTEWADEGWHHADDPDNLRNVFAGFGGVVPGLLRGVEEVGLWGLFRHEVAAQWHAPGVAILGDAAHPTLPFMAQGANLALEDAWVLADCLRRAGDRDAALADYQARRRARAVRVIDAANGNAWKYHLRPGPVRGAAHLGLRLAGRVAPGAMLRGFDWIYGHDVTA